MAHIYNSGMQFLNGVYCYMDKIQIGLILIHDHVVNIVNIKFHLPIFFLKLSLKTDRRPLLCQS